MNRFIYGVMLAVGAWTALTQAGGMIRAIQHPSTGWSLVFNLAIILVWMLLLMYAYRGLRTGDPGRGPLSIALALVVTLVVLQAIINRMG